MTYKPVWAVGHECVILMNLEQAGPALSEGTMSPGKEGEVERQRRSSKDPSDPPWDADMGEIEPR